MASNKYSLEELHKAIKENSSWRQTALTLGLSPDCGGNTKTLKKLASEHNFDYSHFTGKASNKNKHPWNYVPVKEWLKKGIYVKSLYLKNKLLKEKLLDNKCSVCNSDPIWMGKPINFELDHINGDKSDNTLENLRLLCPNCHSQTPTFRGRNIK